MRDPSTIGNELLGSAREGDLQKSAILCNELSVFLDKSADEPPPVTTERIFQELRSKRWFHLIQFLGDAFIASGRGTFRIHRQYAQALIDQGQLDAAGFILNDLVQRTKNLDSLNAKGENAEARGLLGRLYKQQFANNRTTRKNFAEERLKMAIVAYHEVYQLDKAKYLWQGINTVALIANAKKEGIDTQDLPDPQALARDIESVVEQKDIVEEATQWDLATAGEACVAMADWKKADYWFDRYINDPRVGSFELNSTYRQMDEIWQLGSDAVGGSAILRKLNTSIQAKAGYQKLIIPAEEKKGGYEKVFGEDGYQTFDWLKKGFCRSLAVARIGLEPSKGKATGFLMDGAFFDAGLAGEYVLVTNAHVISDDPEVIDTFRPDQVCVVFETVEEKHVFSVEKVCWTSRPEMLDVTIARFYPEDRAAVNAIGSRCTPFPIARTLPMVAPSQRVYIIGHPDGTALSLSLQDNSLLDHDGIKIHYKTPTDPGSSGSPVFNRQWELIGVHHWGSFNAPMLNGKNCFYQANEGISIFAVKEQYTLSDSRCAK